MNNEPGDIAKQHIVQEVLKFFGFIGLATFCCFGVFFLPEEVLRLLAGFFWGYLVKTIMVQRARINFLHDLYGRPFDDE